MRDQPDSLTDLFFINLPVAASCHRVLQNEGGRPLDCIFTQVNETYASLSGHKMANLIGKRFSEIYLDSWPDADKWHQTWSMVLSENKPRQIELAFGRLQKWLRIVVFPLSADEFACTYIDITRRKVVENALRRSEEKYRFLAEFASDMIIIYNLTHHKFTYFSPAVETIRGYSPEEAMAQSLEESMAAESLAVFREHLQQWTTEFLANPEEPNTHFIEIRQPCKNGKQIWIEVSAKFRFNDQQEIEIVSVGRNIEKRKRVEQENHYFSFHDPLTGLLNRRSFDQLSLEFIDQSDMNQEPLSLICFDLDLFKRVNDQWGHQVGDEILKQTALIAAAQVRKADRLARIGGEEFAVILPQTGINGALTAAEKIRKAMELASHPLTGQVTASFGIAERLPDEAFTSWFRRADEALYEAKHTGRNRVVSAEVLDHTPVVSVHLKWKRNWESGIPDIDRQHQRLLELADSLIVSSLSQGNPDTIMQQLDQLLDHIVSHFTDEINILAAVGYPRYAEHEKIHQQLVERALQFKAACLAGDFKPSTFFSFIVDEVIVGHMIEQDSQFFAYTRNKGKT
jgi:diguanylate cyclase (GGDEF)-like protein/hemerythrin-like metal-binding protein/PAS domain S-box-containing protein